MELTDLEICKRIAEIEGHDVSAEDYGIYITEFNANYNCHESNAYNPLSDDALNHQLMIKYNVCLMHYEEYTTARIWDNPEDNPIADFSTINNDTNTNKAILLAIIEAHNEH